MGFQFLARPFSDIPPEQREAVQRILTANPQPLSGYTMATLSAWNPVYNYGQLLLEDGTLLVSCHFGNPQERHLLQPVGPFGSDAQATLVREARKLPYPLRIYGVSPAFLEKHPAFAANFDAVEDRASANYIYKASDLALLEGRAFHKKRNLLTQASREYTHTVEPLTAANAPECLEMANAILVEDGFEMTPTLEAEMTALRFTLTHMDTLACKGVLVRVDGKLAAFNVWEQLTPDTAVIHFEKARRAYKGIYQVVNQEGAKAIQDAGYIFINREEDLGNEGLRQAKLSYNPVEVRPSVVLTLKAAVH